MVVEKRVWWGVELLLVRKMSSWGDGPVREEELLGKRGSKNKNQFEGVLGLAPVCIV